MNAKRDRVFKELFKALYQANNKGTSGYDTTAEVVRVEGDTVWVHIPGGVDETPVKKTIDAVKGDTVQLRVSGGTAWIVGNETKPPTDDRVANVAKKTAENADLKAILAKKTADDASKVATNYIDFTEEDGLTVGHKNLNSKVNISGDGVKLYDENGNVGTEIRSGEVVVGTDETNKITLNNDGIVLSSVEDVETFKAGVSSTSAAIEHIELSHYNEPLVLKKMPDSGSRIIVRDYYGNLLYFTQGVAETQDNIGYDGERTINNQSTRYYYIHYTVTEHLPYLTFGTRSVDDERKWYSATFGQDLIASYDQVVFGNNNIANQNARFIIGRGSILERKNALLVDRIGDLYLYGDVYVGCNNDSTGGNKLVSASITTGNGTVSSVPSGASSLTNLAEVSLDEEGIYLLLGRVRFASNTSGRRGAAWASNPTGYFYHSLVVGAPASGGATLMQTMAIIEVTSNAAPYTAYLNCYHTAGASNPLDVEYYWRYIKLA